MKTTINKKSKWTRIEILTLLGLLSPFLIYILNNIPLIKKILNDFADKIDLPLKILNLIILLILYMLLLLVLYNNCMHKYKTKYKKPLPVFKTPLPLELPPEEYMNRILLLLSKSNSLHFNEICNNFTENGNIIKHYTDSLLFNNYISHCSDVTFVNSLTPPDQLPFVLEFKGREYLIKNKLII